MYMTSVQGFSYPSRHTTIRRIALEHSKCMKCDVRLYVHIYATGSEKIMSTMCVYYCL